MIKVKVPTEHDEQVAFVKWFRLQYPPIRIFAIPNGIRSSFSQARKAKAEGMQSGVPDLFIPQYNLWVEMKRTKGSTTSPEQKDWHYYLQEHCEHTVILAKGCDEAVRKTLEFFDTLNN